MRQKFRSLYIDTQHHRALSITADRIKLTAEFGPFECKEKNSNNHQRNNNANLNISVDIISKFIDRTHAGYNNTSPFQSNKRFILYIERISIDNCRHTAGKEHTGQCNDKRLNLQIGDQKSLYKAKSKPDCERDYNRHEYISVMEVQIHRTAHTDKRGDTAYGNIDSLRDHNKAHAAGQNDQRRLCIQYIEKGLRFPEA